MRMRRRAGAGAAMGEGAGEIYYTRGWSKDSG